MTYRFRACGAALIALSGIVGCGGNVVLDSGTGGVAGGSAAGGSTAVTTTTYDTTYDTTTYVTTTPSSDTTSPTWGTTSTSDTTTITTGQWGGTATCDNSGNCGDSQSGCIACSFESDCAQPYNACVGEQACIDFSNCLANCGGGDQPCIDDCSAENPVGSLLYMDLVKCVLCWSCLNDCASTGGCNN